MAPDDLSIFDIGRQSKPGEANSKAESESGRGRWSRCRKSLNHEWTPIDANAKGLSTDGTDESRWGNGSKLPNGNPGNLRCLGLEAPPPGIPTGFCHKARGCAAAALPRVPSQHINNPKGVVPGNNAGRLSARGRIRQNGQRDHGFSISQPALCGVIKTFVPSAQPRCGCCKHPARTRGNAGLWGTTRWRWGDSTANGREYLKGHLCMSPSHLCSFAVHPLRIGPKNQLWPLALNWGCFWRASKAGAERGAWR